MPTKQEAKDKIAAAEKGCAKVQAEWVAADKALGLLQTEKGCVAMAPPTTFTVALHKNRGH